MKRFLVVLALASGAARAKEPFDEHAACQLKHGLLCSAYAGKDRTPLRNRPDAQGRVVAEIERGRVLLLIDPVTGPADPTIWYRVAYALPPDFETPMTLWVRRGDVVTAEDLRPVVGCWPVRSITFSAADVEGQPEEYRLHFDLAGHLRSSASEHRGARLFAAVDGAFAVVSSRKKPRDQVVFASFLLDLRARVVAVPAATDYGVSLTDFAFAGRDELKGCTSPTLDETRTLAEGLESVNSNATR